MCLLWPLKAEQFCGTSFADERALGDSSSCNFMQMWPLSLLRPIRSLNIKTCPLPLSNCVHHFPGVSCALSTTYSSYQCLNRCFCLSLIYYFIVFGVIFPVASLLTVNPTTTIWDSGFPVCSFPFSTSTLLLTFHRFFVCELTCLINALQLFMVSYVLFPIANGY